MLRQNRKRKPNIGALMTKKKVVSLNRKFKLPRLSLPSQVQGYYAVKKKHFWLGSNHEVRGWEVA